MGAGISACEQGWQWQHALSSLRDIWQAKLEPDVISFGTGINACEKGGQWRHAGSLLRELRDVAKLEPNVISYRAGITARKKDGWWQQTVSMLSDMWDSSLELDCDMVNVATSTSERGGALAAPGFFQKWRFDG